MLLVRVIQIRVAYTIVLQQAYYANSITFTLNYTNSSYYYSLVYKCKAYFLISYLHSKYSYSLYSSYSYQSIRTTSKVDLLQISYIRSLESIIYYRLLLVSRAFRIIIFDKVQFKSIYYYRGDIGSIQYIVLLLSEEQI